MCESFRRRKRVRPPAGPAEAWSVVLAQGEVRMPFGPRSTRRLVWNPVPIAGGRRTVPLVPGKPVLRPALPRSGNLRMEAVSQQ